MDIAEEIKDKISKGLSINRMPNKTHKEFIGLAKEDFCDDYGLTLKFLMDMYNGLINTGVEHLEVAINNINDRMLVLEKNFEKKDEKRKVRLDGK